MSVVLCLRSDDRSFGKLGFLAVVIDAAHPDGDLFLDRDVRLAHVDPETGACGGFERPAILEQGVGQIRAPGKEAQKAPP